MPKDFSIIITALDETWSLEQTITQTVEENSCDIAKIVIVTAQRATPECRAMVAKVISQHPDLVSEHRQQQLPGVGGGIRESLPAIGSAWVVMMASDLETPPEYLKKIISRAKATDDVDIVASSRWLQKGDFGNYSRVKLICNWIFQKFFSALYATLLTDMTYGYRAYRTKVMQSFNWQETGHGFFLESLVKPLRDNRKVVELPVKWRRRQEGSSHIKLSEFLRYFYIGFAVRFMPRKNLYTTERP